MVARKARVYGKVQGVWFRASTRRRAEKLKLSGWAHNCPDGSVEVMMVGSEVAIAALTDWLYEGPPLAVVDRVEFEEMQQETDISGFTTG